MACDFGGGGDARVEIDQVDRRIGWGGTEEAARIRAARDAGGESESGCDDARGSPQEAGRLSESYPGL